VTGSDLTFVEKKMERRSYLGQACARAIDEQLEKMINIDRGQQLADKEKMMLMEDKVQSLEMDVYSYQQQADQMESELENLLRINDMY